MNLIFNTPSKRVNIESSDYTTLSELICDFCKMLSIQGYSKKEIIKELRDTIVSLEADELIRDIEL